MGEYANAVVYKIKTGDFIYVGSTRDFEQRRGNHKYALHNENSHAYNLKLYQAIRANNDEWEMEIIKECPGTNKIELLMEEQKYIDELKPDLNCVSCHGFNKAESDRQYQLKHKEEIYKYRGEQIKCECGFMSTRSHMARHKKTQRHLDWEQNLVKKPYDKNEKIECECGLMATRSNIERHKKSKRHLDLMNQKNT